MIISWNPKGEVSIYKSLKEAATVHKTSSSNISNAIAGRQKTACGYKWTTLAPSEKATLSSDISLEVTYTLNVEPKSNEKIKKLFGSMDNFNKFFVEPELSQLVKELKAKFNTEISKKIFIMPKEGQVNPNIFWSKRDDGANTAIAASQDASNDKKYGKK